MLLLVEGRELVQILLAAGADPTAQDAQHGRTALHTAAMANDVELVKVKKLRYDFILVPSPFLHTGTFTISLSSFTDGMGAFCV